MAASATATVLLSGCRKIFSSTAGLPFAVTMVYTGMTEGCTVAMSPIRTGTPAGVVRTTMLAISAGSRACPLTSVSESS